MKRILTRSSNHWRGIKVILEDGQVGRMQAIIGEEVDGIVRYLRTGQAALKAHITELKMDLGQAKETRCERGEGILLCKPI